VKSAPFSYHRPESIAEAASILAAHEDARVLAGGQSLVPMMNLRIAQPEALVDINHIAGLETLDIEDGELVIGATTRQATLLA
jgi:carbon-monoxide dehydrogenase medium subunit